MAGEVCLPPVHRTRSAALPSDSHPFERDERAERGESILVLEEYDLGCVQCMAEWLALFLSKILDRSWIMMHFYHCKAHVIFFQILFN